MWRLMWTTNVNSQCDRTAKAVLGDVRYLDTLTDFVSMREVSITYKPFDWQGWKPPARNPRARLGSY